MDYDDENEKTINVESSNEKLGLGGNPSAVARDENVKLGFGGNPSAGARLSFGGNPSVAASTPSALRGVGKPIRPARQTSTPNSSSRNPSRWSIETHNREWEATVPCRQSREVLPRVDHNWRRKTLSCAKKEIKILTQLVTRHTTFRDTNT